MAISLGTKSDGGRNLIRNRTKFRQHFDEIDWTKKESTLIPVRTRGGRVTYVSARKET